MKFDMSILRQCDLYKYARYVGAERDPDLVIAPDGIPYLYRWHLLPHSKEANLYFHVQVKDDPKRPLHDHPWDNMSVILAGGYKERLCLSELEPHDDMTFSFVRSVGSIVYRKAAQAHRLELLYGEPYAMTLFMTGPKVKDWGFWYPHGWVPYEQVTRTEDGLSVHLDQGGM